MELAIRSSFCAALFTAGLAAQSAVGEPDPPEIRSRTPVDVSIEGRIGVSARRPGDRSTPFDCVQRIADQSGAGGCLTASSAPTIGLLYPYPGTNNAFVPPAFVGGGENNQASQPWSTVGGGENNVAHGFGGTYVPGHATVAGGESNQAFGPASTVGGGYRNTAYHSWTTVGGGRDNSATSPRASIGGGSANRADGNSSTVGGGSKNSAYGASSTVGGGFNNSAGDTGATVAGGIGNFIYTEDGTIGGGRGNTIRGDGATISGGGGRSGNYGYGNYARARFATIGGGADNEASGTGATIAGGGGFGGTSGTSYYGNTAAGEYSTIGGGSSNDATGDFATIAGGKSNRALRVGAVVGGGDSNTASGKYAAIPGGQLNLARSRYSFAAGRHARAEHVGAFVWGDSFFDGTASLKKSSADDQFNVFCSGGARFLTNSAATAGVVLTAGGGSWSSVSDRDAKENVEPVDGREVLERVTELPLATWNYKAQDDSIRHMGPMAQDFHTAFGLGASDTLIDTIDGDGVALAAIQGLNARLEEKDAEIDELRAELGALRAQVAALVDRGEPTEPR